MLPFTMIHKSIDTRKAFVAELADDGRRDNGLAGVLQTSGWCDSAIVIVLRQAL